MKKIVLFLLFILLLAAGWVGAAEEARPLKIGVIVQSNDPETCWNALRFANQCMAKNDTVRIFLLGKGVELEKAGTKQFNIKEQADAFLKAGGLIVGCGTCMQLRGQDSTKVCPIGCLDDMYDIVRQSDRVVCF